MSTSASVAAKTACRHMVIRLLQEGETQDDVAQMVGVSRSSVKRWKKRFEEHGWEGLTPRPTPRGRRLSARQCEHLRQILLAGAVVAGFDSDLWTCRRVVQVIEREFDITYHRAHVGRIIHALGFSPQKPCLRARERDEAAIQRWRKHDWPRIKKRAAERKLASCFSTKPAFSCSQSVAAPGLRSASDQSFACPSGMIAGA